MKKWLILGMTVVTALFIVFPWKYTAERAFLTYARDKGFVIEGLDIPSYSQLGFKSLLFGAAPLLDLKGVAIYFTTDSLQQKKVTSILIDEATIQLALKDGALDTTELDNFGKASPEAEKPIPFEEITIKRARVILSEGEQVLVLGNISTNIAYKPDTNTMTANADGKLTVTGLELPVSLNASIKLKPLQARASLTLKEVDIGPIIHSAFKEELVISGKIKGILPVSLNSKGLMVHNGKLESTTTGVIRYHPDPSSALANSTDPSLKLTLDALEDFYYQSLTVLVNSSNPNLIKATVHLSGYNQNIFEGRPIELTVAFNGDLLELIRSNVNAQQLPKKIEGTIRQRINR